MQAVSANLFGVMTPWEAAATMIPGPYGSPVATYLVEQIQRRSEAEVRILCAILLATSVHCARSASPIQLAPSGMKMGFKPWLRHPKTCEKPTKAQGPVPKQLQERPNTRVGWCWGRGWTGEGDQILV